MGTKTNLYVIDTNKPFQGHVITTATKTGKIHVNYNEPPITFEEYQKLPENQGCNLKIINEVELDELLKNYENSLTDNWTEITKDRYWELLECLPPVYWFNGGFYVSEAYTGLLHTFCQEWQGKYYSSLQDITKDRAEIIESLKQFIKNL